MIHLMGMMGRLYKMIRFFITTRFVGCDTLSIVDSPHIDDTMFICDSVADHVTVVLHDSIYTSDTI